MKVKIRYKIAAGLALFIGLMSVIAGTRVLLGVSTPDYHVLDWLVSYNVIVGIISIIAATLIWQRDWQASPTSLVIIAAHAIVLILLLTVFSESVAMDSIMAMVFRVGVWSGILVLSLTQVKKNKVFI